MGAKVYVWDTRAGGRGKLAVRNPTKRSIRSTALHPSGTILAGLTGDNTVAFFDVTSGKLLKTYEWPIGDLRFVKFTPDGTRCVVCSRLGKVLLFDVD